MGFHKLLKVSLLVTLHLVTNVFGDRILLLMPIGTRSETHLLNPIAKALLDRGHQVTLVTPSSSSIKHKNFKEVVPTKPLDFLDFDKSDGNILDIRGAKDDVMAVLFLDMSYITERCHEVYKNKEFGSIIQKDSYDLVLTSAFFSECFLGVIHKLKAPYIQISSMPLPKFALDSTGLRTPLSFVPNSLLELTDAMTLGERIMNTLSSWSFTLLNYHHYYKLGENVYKEYLGQDLPSVEELRKNVSLVFSNTHFSMNFPRPLMPDVVEIGGVHCHPAKPLPKDIEDFVSGDKNGFIFFSMGTVFKEELMPEGLKQLFINVFSRLKLRVLWKWKTDIPGLPKNIKVSKWLPQQDVLGHPNIKLFISHGGLLSTQESTYHGVPILGIPLFADQDVNMKQAQTKGFAVKLELLDLTEESFENAILKMLNDPSYYENALKVSALFRDQQQTPLERAVYWMEYLIKHKGAPELRSHARNLSYFEYHLYDVQLILLSILGTIIFVVWKIISKCLSLVWGKDDENLRKRSLKKKE